jgi:CheY-like chemotaxis protein/two-component sensor histidine kinase
MLISGARRLTPAHRSQLEELRSRILKAEAALAESDARKEAFLATLSHELRNPLAPIRTAARLLQSSHLEPVQVARAESIISRQVSHMSSLLDDLLDVARITRGAFLLKREYVDVEQLIDAAVEAAQPAIDDRHHLLQIERADDTVLLDVDPVRLTQVVSNLLTNAARYTPSGGRITLGVRHAADALDIFVRDTGIGLAPDTLQSVFGLFTRIEPDPDRPAGGLGIGLALVKGLVELHGGRIEARSAGLGHGSEFVVSLPGSLIVEEPVPVAGSSAPSAASPPPRRVLLADDNRDGAETLGMFLGLQGHEVHLAYGGAEALNLARKLRPEVAVLDIGMPDLSGYDVARCIRREPWGERVTLIALTGWSQEKDKRRAELAGFDHHVTKPVDPERLEHLFSRRPAAPGGA